MQPIPALYPPRARALNVSLIRHLVEAADPVAFEAADAEAAAQLHPSLLAEMDWMERSVPEPQRAGVRRFVHGFYVQHLPAFIALRRAEFDVADEVLRVEVEENIDFYRQALDDDRDPLAALGAAARARIVACAAAAATPDASWPRWRAAARERVADRLAPVRDIDWLPLRIECALQNALALTLDHPSSRIRAKNWWHEQVGDWSALDDSTGPIATRLGRWREQLSELGRSARQAHLPSLWALCDALAEHLAGRAAADFGRFDGALAKLWGPCRRCSMPNASTAIVSYEPTCPGLFNEADGTLHLPLDFNVATCPFCGARSRVESPFLFYSSQCHRVLYNCPRLGQDDEAAARALHRPVLQQLRARFIARLSADEARRFQTAGEEFSYDTAQFLLAVQMGTTAREHHVCNLVRLADGSGLVVDRTKGVMISLLPDELDAIWAPSPVIGTPEDLPASDSADDDAGMPEAMSAFARGDAARARDILQRLLLRCPGDPVVRKNLAVACLELGDREAARRAMAGVVGPGAST